MKGIMENRLTKKVSELIGNAEVARSAVVEHGPTIPLSTDTAANLGVDIDALTTKRDIHEAAIVALTDGRRELALLVAAVRMFLTFGRDSMKQVFGTRYSTAYNILGFSRSLMIPRNTEELLAMLLAFEAFYTDNPQHENAQNNLTAVRAKQLFTQLAAARTDVNTKEAEAQTLRRERDVAAGNLRKRLRMLIVELNRHISPVDPRWLAFGFNKPGAQRTPDAPENVTVSPITNDKAEIKWDRAPRAEYYHVQLKVNGIDAQPRLVGSPKDPNFMLEEIPANATVEVGISALNSGGESRLSETIIIKTQPSIAP